MQLLRCSELFVAMWLLRSSELLYVAMQLLKGSELLYVAMQLLRCSELFVAMWLLRCSELLFVAIQLPRYGWEVSVGKWLPEISNYKRKLNVPNLIREPLS